MSIRSLLALLAAALLALGAIACGSDDDGGDGGGGGADSAEQEPLDRSEYLDQVNDAQQDFASRSAKLDLANPSSPKDFKASLDRLGPLIDDLTQRLDEIQPPASVSAQHDRLVAQLTEYGDTIDEQKGGLSSGDQKEVVDSATEIGTASTTFSTDFSKTIQQINGRLQ